MYDFAFKQIRQSLGGCVKFIITGSAPISPQVCSFNLDEKINRGGGIGWIIRKKIKTNSILRCYILFEFVEAVMFWKDMVQLKLAVPLVFKYQARLQSEM
jgi:hypothetical protein